MAMAAILVMLYGSFIKTLVPPSHGGFTRYLALIGQVVSKKIFESGGRTDDGRQTDGRTPEQWYTISSPCKPYGSNELIIIVMCTFSLVYIETVTYLPHAFVRMANSASLGIPAPLRVIP